MSDAIRTAGQNLWLWRTIIFTGINGYFIAVAGAVIAAHLLSPTQESWLGCLIVGAKFLEGFIHQGIAQLKTQIAAQFNDTAFFQKLKGQIEPPAPITETETKTTEPK